MSILCPCKKEKLIDLIAFIFRYRCFPWHNGWAYSSLSFDAFPLSIEPGKSHDIFVSEEVLEKILRDSDRREIKAAVQDQLWRNKYSRKFKVLKYYP
jgi:hypothetical protein